MQSIYIIITNLERTSSITRKVKYNDNTNIFSLLTVPVWTLPHTNNGSYGYGYGV